jgi:hypothetical protein
MPGMDLLAMGSQDTYLLARYGDYTYDNDTDNNDDTDIDWCIISKPLNSLKNTECPITLSPIELNDTYWVCDICMYNFLSDALKTALKK